MRLQGGADDPAKRCDRFEQEPWFRSAVAVRRWDDAAKVPGLVVPGLEHYRPHLEAVLCRERGRMNRDYDVGVVGAGILGLAHAYHLARRGLRVVVFERHPRAQGASVRNFGMIWPIGQPSGPRYDLARRSRDLWLEVLQASGLWHAAVRLAARGLSRGRGPGAARVRRARHRTHGRPCELWTPAQVADRFPAVRQAELCAGLWSPVEVGVDPRQVIAELPDWLTRTLGVDFAFGTTGAALRVPAARHDQRRLVGSAVWSSAPEPTSASWLPPRSPTAAWSPCKLQMMRSQAYGDRFRLGTLLAAGLTLRHYPSFATCPTLPALSRRLDAELARVRPLRHSRPGGAERSRASW